MAVISGNAKKFDGTAIDYVSIFNWSDGKCIAQVIPDALGNWSYSYIKTLKIGVTYVANGCEPITHGKYTLATKARYWRVSNIVARIGNTYKGIATLQFISNIDTNLSTDPTKGFASHYFGSPSLENAPANAFDADASTWTEVNASKFAENWTLGYDFGEDVIIKSVGVAGRNDLPSGLGREWQTADIEVSSDGVSWTKVGTFEPMTAAESSLLVVKPINFI